MKNEKIVERKPQYFNMAPFRFLDHHLKECSKRDLIELVKDLRMEIKKMKRKQMNLPLEIRDK